LFFVYQLHGNLKRKETAHGMVYESRILLDPPACVFFLPELAHVFSREREKRREGERWRGDRERREIEGERKRKMQREMEKDGDEREARD
jgi:hypothetical protein